MDFIPLQDRLKRFAIDIVKFADQLPNTSGYTTVKRQIIRSGPSSAANYRSACRAKSNADFIHKMGYVEEELDETMFWLEFTIGLSDEWQKMVGPLWKEADELVRITVASINTARKRKR